MSGVSQSGVSRSTGIEYVRDTANNITGLRGDGNLRRPLKVDFSKGTRPGFPLLAYPRSSADHSTITNADTPAVPTYTTRDGIPVVRIVPNSGTTSHLNVTTFTGRLALLGQAHILLYINEPSKVTSISLTLFDAGYANAYTFSQGIAASAGWPGWYMITIDPPQTGAYSGLSADADQAHWTVGAGSPDFATTLWANADLEIDAEPSQQPAVEVAGIWLSEANTKPSIIFTSDDTELSWYTIALPILEKYGLRGTQCAIGKYFGESGYMTIAQAQDAYSRGHEFIPHGVGTYPDPGWTYGDLRDYSTVAEMVADIEANRAPLIANGLVRNRGGINCYAYASGIYQVSTTDTKIQAALTQCGIKYARLASPYWGGLISNAHTVKAGKYLGIIGHYYERNGAPEANNIARQLLRMQQAIANGRSCIFMHHTYGGSVNAANITAANFELVCIAAANLITAGTARNLLFSEFALECDEAAII